MANSKSNNSAIALILIGVVSYIIVDSGIINWSPSNLLTSSTEVDDDGTQLLAQSKKLKFELQKLEKDVTTGKTQLARMTSESIVLEKKIGTQKNTLLALEKEVTALAALKKNIKMTKSSLRDSEVQRDITSAMMNALNDKMIQSSWSSPPQTPSELQNLLTDLTDRETRISKVTSRGQNYLRINTDLKYAGEESFLLTTSGLRQVGLITEGGIQMGFNNLKLAYSQRDQLIGDRITAIKQYLSKTYGTNLQISRTKVSNDLDLAQGLEIWFEE